MSTTTLRIALAALTVAACDGPAAPAGVERPVFTLRLSEALHGDYAGPALVVHDANGYAVVDAAGSRSEADLTTVTMFLPDAQTLSIGLIGEVRAGTYDAQLASTVEPMKFIAELHVPQADGSRLTYEVTDGQVSITSVSPHLEGTFQLRATRVYHWPHDPAIGTIVRATSTSVGFAGALQ